MESPKPVHTIILDAGPILKNDPPLNALLQTSERLVTVPAVIAEIKDPHARSRVEMILMPFLDIKTPSVQSLKVITDFARKTGDLAVLSKPDIQILALAYEIECEKNGGDWRLRRLPGQKGTNGSPSTGETVKPRVTPQTLDRRDEVSLVIQDREPSAGSDSSTDAQVEAEHATAPSDQTYSQTCQASDLSLNIQRIQVPSQKSGKSTAVEVETSNPTPQSDALEQLDSDSSESDGWITPSNVKKYQAKDVNPATVPIPDHSNIQVATITTDFAMQNVLLQMNLNLLSASLQRVKKLKTWILRCHACFAKTKDMSKQFCGRCGKPTLTRVSCTVDQNGKFALHLKKNMQWNHRGDRFSIPKPVSGAASGKVGQGKGGGKGGWGQELILVEDQKEYSRALGGQSRRKEKDLMDEDYLPGILTGDRGWNGGRPKVGGGRNINSKKR